MEKIKVFEAFAGYGSQSMALKRANIDFEVVGISEIDKYAIAAYNAVHGETKNFGDISKIKTSELPDFDLFTYSFPCQDISVSGKQAGVKEGTRSGLLWECERIIRDKKPKFLLMENVKNLVGKKHKADFDRWCFLLESYGYQNHWEILNAKEHGVPQNRERVFMISILGGGEFKFPEKEELKIFLKDVLEDEVPENFYLRPEQYANLLKNLPNLNTNPSGKGMNGKVHVGDIAPTLTTNKGEGIKMAVGCAVRGRNPENPTSRKSGLPTKQMLESEGNEFSNCLTTVQKDSLVAEIMGHAAPKPHQQSGVYNPEKLSPTILATHYKNTPKIAELKFVGGIGDKDIVGNGKNNSRNFPQGNRVYSENGIAVSQTANGGGLGGNTGLYTNGIRVRKLTPLEYFRLMDVADTDYHKIKKALNETFYKGKDRSNSQMYKLAGNSIVVRPLMKIFKNIPWT